MFTRKTTRKSSRLFKNQMVHRVYYLHLTTAVHYDYFVTVFIKHIHIFPEDYFISSQAIKWKYYIPIFKLYFRYL